MRLIDADALRDVTPEATYGGSIMRELIDDSPTISCETCIHGDRATLNGEPTNEPNVYCGVTCLWWESFAGCNRYQPREEQP